MPMVEQTRKIAIALFYPSYLSSSIVEPTSEKIYAKEECIALDHNLKLGSTEVLWCTVKNRRKR